MKKLMTLTLAFIVAVAMGFTCFGQDADAASKKITAAKAKSIAYASAKVTGSKIRALDVEYDGEDKVYEVEFIKKKNGAEFSFEVAAYGGRILSKSVDFRYKAKKSTKKVGVTKARKKVASFSGISYSTIKKGSCVFKSKKYGSKYELKFRKGNYRYEAEVLARNGQIIEWEYEYVKR